MHANNDEMVDYFAKRVPASRMMVNTPSALGGIGGTTGLMPSLTLGCGAVGGSATTENVGPMNLLEPCAMWRMVRANWKTSAQKFPTALTVSAPPAPAMGEIDVDAIVRSVIDKLKAL